MPSSYTAQLVHVCSEEEEDLILKVLRPFLPYCISAYRRIQLRKLLTPSARVISTRSPQELLETPSTCFGIAYIDRSRRPEVESDIFLTSEIPENAKTPKTCGTSCENCNVHLLSLLKCISERPVTIPEPAPNRPWTNYSVHASKPNLHLTGSIDATSFNRIKALGIGHDSRRFAETPYHSFIFQGSDPKLQEAAKNEPGPGLRYAPLKHYDHFLMVAQKTRIFRQVSSLQSLYSCAVFPVTDAPDKDVLPVAWGFIGVNGALASLHVEDEYRGKGLAKKLAARIVTESLKEEGYGQAHVALENRASQGVCKGIGGTVMGGTKHWVLIDLDRVLEIVQ
jgi:ribosomal protein S18 acetylase RimI-like enzyme